MAATKGGPPSPGDVRRVRAAAEQEGGAHETARRSKTRERLMDAAYRLFSEHGINGTSIEAVTDEAGFTRGAFYSNFGSKSELFLALNERENRMRLEMLRQRFGSIVEQLGRAEGKPDPELIQGVIADILSYQSDTRQWCLMLSEFRLLAMRDPEVAPRFLDNTRAFLRQLAEMIEVTLRAVGLRFVIDSVHLAQLLLSQYEAAMQEAILSGGEDSEGAARETIMQTLPVLLHSLTELAGPSNAER